MTGLAFRVPSDLRPSIREFCDLTVPILMFDKNANFVVMTIQEVSTFPSACECCIFVLNENAAAPALLRPRCAG